MLEKQKGVCAICEQPFPPLKAGYKTPHIDHDHTSGKVRGLLCIGCNTWLGRYERPGFLEKAKEYLGKT